MIPIRWWAFEANGSSGIQLVSLYTSTASEPIVMVRNPNQPTIPTIAVVVLRTSLSELERELCYELQLLLNRVGHRDNGSVNVLIDLNHAPEVAFSMLYLDEYFNVHLKPLESDVVRYLPVRVDSLVPCARVSRYERDPVV